MNNSQPQRPKRRWCRFSLRTLLIVVVLLSVPLGWFALKIRQAGRQRTAVEAIRKAGGVVWYDYQLNDMGAYYVTRPKPPVPTWLRGLFGDDCFLDVINVDAGDFSDQTMTHLAELSDLKRLALMKTAVTDAGLEHLQGLPHLESLALEFTKVTDVGLEHLKGLAHLRMLSLVGTHVTDNGLEHLKGLTSLTELHLEYTRVTDKGVENLQQALPNCSITGPR